MPIQMRLSPNDDRFYSPDRDLAYCSPHLIHRALLGLDPEKQEPWVTQFIYENGVSNDELLKAGVCLAEYMNKSLADPVNKDPYEALQAAGFFNLSAETQCIVCAKIGQVFLSAIFTSLRDIIRDPKDLPYDTKSIADVAGVFLKRLSYKPLYRRLLDKIKHFFGLTS